MSVAGVDEWTLERGNISHGQDTVALFGRLGEKSVLGVVPSFSVVSK